MDQLQLIAISRVRAINSALFEVDFHISLSAVRFTLTVVLDASLILCEAWPHACEEVRVSPAA